MANEISLKVELRGMREMQRIMERLTRKIQTRTDLHARWAILALNWINKNFSSEGGMVGGWKPLSPNTLANRRSGTGKPLLDTGRLRGSFIPRWNSVQASVGSNLEYAIYHELGTRPHEIHAKPGGTLAFKVATSQGVKTKLLKSGRVLEMVQVKGDYVHAQVVHHPGIVRRRMLPTQNDPILMRDLLRAGLIYLQGREAA
jgi:phage gpG-like protein